MSERFQVIQQRFRAHGGAARPSRMPAVYYDHAHHQNLIAINDEIVLKFNTDNQAVIAAWITDHGCTVIAQTPGVEHYQLQLPAGDTIADVIDAFRADPLLAWAEPNALDCDNDQTPNDPAWATQTNYYDDVDLQNAWDVDSGSANVIVAFTESFDLDHEDLAANRWTNPNEVVNGVDDDGNGYIDDVDGWDFYENDASVDPGVGDGVDDSANGSPDGMCQHGTMVAGTVGAVTNNGVGVAGALWNVRLMPLKTTSDDGDWGLWSARSNAIVYAVNNGARVINCSASSTTNYSYVLDAVKYAYENGVVVTCSMGNNNYSTVKYPCGYDTYVIAVGASDNISDPDGRAYFSNWQSYIDVVAPGRLLPLPSFYTQYDQDTGTGTAGDAYYPNVSGTSFSAPLTAALAAMIISRYETLDKPYTVQDVFDLIRTTAEDLPDDAGDNPDFGAAWDGWGMIDFKAAMDTITMPANPTTWYVSASLGADTPGVGIGTSDTPFRSITRAMEFARDGDTIYVHAGTYAETVAFDTNNLMLIGEDSTTTIIDPPGDSATAGVYACSATNLSGLMVSGFTIQDAKYGIWFDNVDSATIENDSVVWTWSGGIGEGAINLRGGSTGGRIQGCYISKAAHGIVSWSSDSNTITNNTVINNAGSGISVGSNNNVVYANWVEDCVYTNISTTASGSNNTFVGNVSTASHQGGLQLYNGSSNNLVRDNKLYGNTYDGININLNSSNNVVANNYVYNNGRYGVVIDNSDGNYVTQNTVRGGASNGDTLVYFDGTSSNDTVTDNNIYGSFAYGIGNATVNAHYFSNNYWGVTDADSVANMGFGDTLSPGLEYFLLSAIDTAVGADTLAPETTTITSADTSTFYAVTLTWDQVDENEDGSALADFLCYRIYRTQSDTETDWKSNALLMAWGGAAGDATFTDTTVTVGETYYYRVTAVDNASPYENESFFSAICTVHSAEADTSLPNHWYVDISAGDTANHGMNAANAKKYLSNLALGNTGNLSWLTEGDTVHIAAGTYSETITIDTDYIWILGADSATTIINYGDSSSSAYIGIKADTQVGLVISGLTVVNSYHGIEWINVDEGQISDVSSLCNNQMNIVLKDGSGANTVTGCYTYLGTYGIVVSQSNSNAVTGCFADDHNLAGIYLSSAVNSTVSSNLSRNNTAYGFWISSGVDSNVFADNVATGNGSHGFYLEIADSNTFTGNTSAGNGKQGFRLNSSSDSNCFIGNTAYNNLSTDGYGFYLSGGSDNYFSQNTADSNTMYGFYLTGPCSADTFTNNLWAPGEINPDSGIWSDIVDTTFDVSRNYWSTTDEDSIAHYVQGAGAAQLWWAPYRLGRADTAPTADVVAPDSPIILSADTSSYGVVVLTWSEVTQNEDGSALGDFLTYRIFRSDTLAENDWKKNSFLTSQGAAPTDTSFTDSTVALGATYYYRVTAVDAAAPWENESFFSDTFMVVTLASPDTSGANEWYINVAMGDTANHGLTGGAPKKYLTNIFTGRSGNSSFLTAGDTVYIAAGTYGDTVIIDTDYIWVIGGDSSTTILDYGDSSAGPKAKGIYADTQLGLTVQGIRITGCYEGIWWDDIDNSQMIDIASSWNAIDGIYIGLSDTNVFTNVVCSNNGSIGFELQESHNNRIDYASITGNTTEGIDFGSSDSNTLYFADCNDNLWEGVNVRVGSDNNLFYGLVVDGNGLDGINISRSDNNTFLACSVRRNVGAAFDITTAHGNTFYRNLAQNSTGEGFKVTSSGNNLFYQNDCDSNAGYQVSLDLCTADTLIKNIFTASPANPDSGALNSQSDSYFEFHRNYWGSADSAAIAADIHGAGAGQILWQPYRLGTIDTAAGADTIAPAAPDTVVVSDSYWRTGYCTVTWSVPAMNEEVGSALGDLAGYRVYRSLDPNTSNWGSPRWTTTTTSFIDSGLAINTDYHYRVTAYDNHSPWTNESWYSDSVAVAHLTCDTSGADNWYIDIAAGDTFNHGLTAALPKKYLSNVFGSRENSTTLLTEGDTVHIAAGTYADTITIDTDYIWVLGADSTTTIIDYGDSGSTVKAVAIYAAGRTGLTVQELQVTNCYKGIELNDVDYSTLQGVAGKCNGENGFYLAANSDTNTVTGCYTYLGNYGARVEGSGNTLTNNVAENHPAAGVAFISGYGNSVTYSTARNSAGSGFYIWSDGHTLANNTASNCGYGIYLVVSEDNTLTNNVSTGNSDRGFYLNGADNNILTGNVSSGNAYGYFLNAADNNLLVQNTADSNSSYGFAIDGSSTGDAFCRNFFNPGEINHDSGVWCDAANDSFDLTRNYWSTTNEDTLAAYMHGVYAGNLVWYPYRLGRPDTTAGADTIAPDAPVILGADTSIAGTITITWNPVMTDEVGAALADFKSYAIYRTENAGETDWKQNAFMMAYGGIASDTSFADTNVVYGRTYYYRVTAVDNNAPWENESFFSDTIAVMASLPDLSGPNDWYIDIATGDTDNNGLYDTTPKKYLTNVFSGIAGNAPLVGVGDTVYIAAGTYSETFSIDTDYVWVIGSDSTTTIFDYGDSSSTASRANISADTQTGLTIRNLGITNVHDAIRWLGVTNSSIKSVSMTHCGNSGGGTGINFDSCSVITIENSYVYESGNGMSIWKCRDITVSNNIIDNCDLNGLYIGYSDSCTVTNNVSQNNSSYGFEIHNLSYDAYIGSNTATRNGGTGFYSDISDRHKYVENTSTDNGVYGFEFYTCNDNELIRNVCSNNQDTGFYFWRSNNNIITQNDCDSNAGYALVLEDCTSCTFTKNNISMGELSPTYGINISTADTPVDVSRNYWDIADSAAIASYIQGTGNGAASFAPFRFGRIDTAAGADTLAPAAPDTVVVSDSSQTNYSCTITWSVPTTNEEVGSSLTDLQGYRIYRDTAAVSDSWLLLGTTTGTTWCDSGLTGGQVYYYKVTAYDNHSPWENESWYSDSIASVVILAKPGDFVHTGASANKVDDADLAYLNGMVALYWGTDPVADPRVDLNSDNILDFEDIAIFATLYGT